MKKILVVLGLIVASTAIATPSQAVNPVQEVHRKVTVPIVAMEASLTFPRVTVTTAPAPKPVVVPEVVELAPVVAEVPQIKAVPTVAPEVGVVQPVEEPQPKPAAPVSDKCIEVYEDGSCITENGFIEPGTSEEITTAPVEEADAPIAFEEGIEDESVENNGNPDCQVPDAIQWSDGSCAFTNSEEEPVEKDVQPVE